MRTKLVSGIARRRRVPITWLRIDATFARMLTARATYALAVYCVCFFFGFLGIVLIMAGTCISCAQYHSSIMSTEYSYNSNSAKLASLVVQQTEDALDTQATGYAIGDFEANNERLRRIHWWQRKQGTEPEEWQRGCLFHCL